MIVSPLFIMGRAGVEPATQGFSVLQPANVNTAKTSTSGSYAENLASTLTLCFKKYPDLAVIVDAWPNLQQHIRQAIITLAEVSRKP